jgi:hypothetical protein
MKKALLVLLLVGVVGLLSSAPALAMGFKLSPGSQTVNQGGTASVDIVATPGPQEIVAAYDFDIAYDASIVTATGVTFGTWLGDESLLEAFTDFDLSTLGLIDLAEVSFLSDADLALLQGGGEITLATLTFTGDNSGTSLIQFINYGSGGNDVKGASNTPYGSPGLTNGSITVVSTGVPEPSTLLLLGLGLLGFAGLRKRFKK